MSSRWLQIVWTISAFACLTGINGGRGKDHPTSENRRQKRQTDRPSLPGEFGHRKISSPHHSRDILKLRSLICHYRGPFETTKKMIASYQQLQMSHPTFSYRISDGQCELHNIPPGVDAKCQAVRYSIAENKSGSKRKRISSANHHWGIGEDDSRLGCAISLLRRFHIGCEARGVPVPIASIPGDKRLPLANDYDYDDAEGVGTLRWQKYATVIMTEFVCYCDGQFCNSPPEARPEQVRLANRENKADPNPTETQLNNEKLREFEAVKEAVTNIIPNPTEEEEKRLALLQQPQKDHSSTTDLRCASSGVSIALSSFLSLLTTWASFNYC